ncbi:hypothetical protein EVG20_g8976, partial [Dentipellis fragilis]
MFLYCVPPFYTLIAIFIFLAYPSPPSLTSSPTNRLSCLRLNANTFMAVSPSPDRYPPHALSASRVSPSARPPRTAPPNNARRKSKTPTQGTWTTAFILSNQRKWQNISRSIPTNIQPKGFNKGGFSNVSYTSADLNCLWTYGKCTMPNLTRLPPDVSSMPEPKTTGYSFDNCPNCSHNAFYDFLQQNSQKATIFFFGSKAMDWPLDGHEICFHTWSHRYMTSFQSQDVFAELWYTVCAPSTAPLHRAPTLTSCPPTDESDRARHRRHAQLLEAKPHRDRLGILALILVLLPCAMPLPLFGDVDDRISAIANTLKLQTIIWKYDSNDWRAGTGGVTPADVDSSYTSFIGNVASATFNN